MSAEDPQTDRELLLQINEKMDILITCKDDHEVRIRSLENSFWKMMGLAGIIGFVSGWFGKTFGSA